MLGLPRSASCRGRFRSNNLLTFPCLYIFESLTFLKKNFELFSYQPSVRKDLGYSFRQSDLLPLPHHRTTFFEKQCKYSCLKMYNNLPASIRSETEISTFRRKIKTLLLNKEYYSVSSFMNDKELV